ncbi:hypothetical protein AURDEDRAFT_117136 [Auricularia subglabra TFB-10046 SS5]|nr:hypothetical protein AURDEDRAFT_117136 [Auricularia subglabra TFB-10046 SS5]
MPELLNVISSGSESDSSIVFDDLVRAGEASRLRRRGALRLDTARAWTAVALDGSSADGLLSGLVAAAHASGSQAQHRIFRGARDWAHDRAPRPSPLPGHQDYGEQPWTGCRALVHDSALPCVRDGTWFARGAAQGTVARLDQAYFERGGRRIRRPCGCASDGVGCRTCGNPLGSVFRPCARHLRLFPAGALPFYSFFASATDADPPFPFPSPSVAPPPLNSPHEPHPTSSQGDTTELFELLDSPKF